MSKLIEVGKDKDGQPLYQTVEALTFPLSVIADDHARNSGDSISNHRGSNVSAVFIEVRNGSDLEN